MANLSVVIVSWNVRELLRGCLRSLFADLEGAALKAQVWVVDNASADGSAEMVAADFPQARLIASKENLGFAAGNNVALRAMQTEHESPFVWLLNPDTEVLPGATAALLAALQGRQRVGVVGARLLNPDGSLQHSAFRFPGIVQLLFELFPLPPRLYETPLNGRYPRRLYEGETPFAVDHPLGASMVVRAEAIAQVGLLDEGYAMYCEEIDWCWRMRRAGWQALCAPAARVVHYGGQSTAQAPLPSFVNLWTSRARLYAHHHGALRYRLARAIVEAGMRRRMRGAGPELSAACQQIVRAWRSAR